MACTLFKLIAVNHFGAFAFIEQAKAPNTYSHQKMILAKLML